MQVKKNYNIGLDIGTSSVGWAVVEEDTYRVMKKGNKSLWGVRLFDEATTAETRRMARSTRRRYDRRRKRIKLLREIFQEEINKVDHNFFVKLKEAAYHDDDATNKTIKLSKEEKKQIKEYYKKYPTIYHLRNAVMKGEETDIRLVYLAIHHIIKYRGNFLYNQESFNLDDLNIQEKLRNIFENLYALNTTLELGEIYSINYNKLEEAILEYSKVDKKRKVEEQLKEILPAHSLKEFSKMIIGNKFSVEKLFGLECESKTTISFKGTDYEDKHEEIEKTATNMIEVLNEMRELYNMIFLKELFKGQEQANISSLMIEKYNIHKEDLNFLKSILKSNKDEFNKMFKNICKNKSSDNKEHTCIYEQYIHNNKSYEEFIKELNKSLSEIEGIDPALRDLYTTYYKQRIENGEFLPRITDTDNGKYPYQLNKEELIKIIENQPYKILKEKIKKENGKEIYKLVQLLEFRIPYYVGPLNNTTDKKNIENPNAWLKKIEGKENILKITPFNFDEVVDKDETAEKFIKRMISKCTYLLKEESIPADSILYSEFKVRNELKQIKINGYKLPIDLQERIYKGLFLKETNTIDDKKLKRYLLEKNEFPMSKDLEITGYSADNKFANTMKSYVDFFGTDGIFINTPYTTKDAENIISWITIFEDKEILERKVRKTYPDLSDIQLKKVLSKKYKGWSRLSRKLLTGISTKEKSSGISKSIMDLMRETECNFMQILNKKEYGFQEIIEKENNLDKNLEITYELVKDLVTSPANKRGIYQALLVVKEIVNYLGYEPSNIILEMARSDEKKQRKDSRKEYLKKLYENCKDDNENHTRLLRQLEQQEERSFDNQKLFLYFIQEGKSLYSGIPLNIEDLDSYEIDHIIPRTLIKDDSIDNKALVLREENQKKAASFIVPQEYRNKCSLWWEKLYKNNLISAKKKYNLQRKYYSEDDIEGFINRQIVESRQIMKNVGNILKAHYKNSKVYYLHADVSHNYREKYELYKFRQINDYHHAHDAYLSVVLSRYKENYLPNADFEMLKIRNKELFEQKNYKEMNYGYLVNSINITSFNKETGEIFDKDYFNNIVEKTLYRNDILISKKTEIKTGEFYNQTKNKKGGKGVPLKDNLSIEKYGAYTSLNPAYACVVRYKKGLNIVQKMIGIPIYIDAKSKVISELKINYIKDLLGIKFEDEVEIIKDRIPFNAILDWDGQVCSLVGATDKVEVCNAKQFKIRTEKLRKWKYTLNRLLNKKKIEDEKLTEYEYEINLGEILEYILNEIEEEYKLYINLLPELKERIHNTDLNIEQKEEIIKELFNLLKFNSKTANLKELGLSGWYGKKNDRIISGAKIIYNSVTGINRDYYEF